MSVYQLGTIISYKGESHMYSTLRYKLESNGTTYENDSINASLLGDKPAEHKH